MREKLSKKISYTLIILLLFGNFPAVSLAEISTVETINAPLNIQSVDSAKNAYLPPFPSDNNSQEIDWSNVDFEKEISMISDYEEYRHKTEELKRQNKYEEIKNLKIESHQLWDDEIMEHYGAPPSVKDLVVKFRDNYKQTVQSGSMKRQMSPDFISAKSKLKQDILDIDKTITPFSKQKEQTVEFEQFKKDHPNKDIINFQSQNKIELIGADKLVPFQKVQNKKGATLQQLQKTAVDGRNTIRKEFTINKYTGNILNKKEIKLQSSIPWVQVAKAADPPANPIMNYYEGIENNDIDHVLRYLTLNQNADGSFGTFNNYDLSAQIALALSRFNKTDNDQYLLLLEYLTNTQPQNNREKAIKARLMFGLGEPYQDLISNLVAQKNSDGGYGYDSNYPSDAETTLEVIWALWVTNMHIEEQLPQALNYVLGQIETDGNMKYTDNEVSSYYLINKTVEYLNPLKEYSVGDSNNRIAVRDKINALLGYLTSQYNNETETLNNSESVIDELMTAYSFKINGVQEQINKTLENKASYQRWFNGSYGDSLYGIVSALKTLPKTDLEITKIENTGTLVNGGEMNLKITVKNNGYAKSEGDTKLYFIVDNYLVGTYTFSGQESLEIMPLQETSLIFDYADTEGFIGDTEIKFYIEQENEIKYENNWKAQPFFFANSANGAPPLPIDYNTANFPVEAIQGQPVVGIDFGWGPFKNANRANVVALFRPSGSGSWYSWPLDRGGVFLYNLPQSQFPEGGLVDSTVGVYDSTQGKYKSLPITQVRLSANRANNVGSVKGTLEIYNRPCAGCGIYAGDIITSTDSLGYFENNVVPNGRVFVKTADDQNQRIYKSYNVPVGGTVENINVISHLLADSQPPVISQLKIEDSDDMIVNNNTDASIYIKTTDNIAIKEIDLYYYNPKESVWVYIGTSTNSLSDRTFNWYIPSGIFGTDYKIKAVARDYQNNESSAVEWGPFVITDTTDYTPPVINDFFIIGESDYILNNEMEYNMEINGTDNGKITFCEAYLFNPKTNSWDIITSRSCDGKGDVLTWNIPAETFGTGFKIKAIVHDSFSNVSLAKEWGPFEIINSHPPDNEVPVIDILELRFSSSKTFKNQTSYQILVDGHDNGSFKEADLYYWDPTLSGWEFIGTRAAMNNSQIYTPWIIPATLLGSGYKLKAVVRDTSGNVSDPKEWGPFTIIDGTLPTGTIEVLNLNDGKWNINETKTISWNINSITQLKGISSINLVYGSANTNITSNYDITKNTISYQIPLNSNFITDSAYITMSVYDSNYNHGTIQSSPFKITDTSAPPHAPWSTPQMSDLVLNGSKLDRSINQIFKNNDGSIEIIYYEWDGWSFEEPGQYRRLMYRKYANNTWQNPVIINEYRYHYGETDDTSLSGINSIKGANGDIHISYRSFTDTASAWEQDENRAHLGYIHLNGGNIVTQKQLPTGLSPTTLNIISNSQNRIFIAWIEGFDWVTRTGDTSIQYMEGDGINSWTSPVMLPDKHISDLIMSLENDSPLLIFRANTQFNLIKKTNYIWPPSIIINDGASDSSSYNIFSRGNNEYDLFYLQSTQENNYRNNIYHTRFSINPQNGQRTIIKYQTIINLMGTEDVRSYKVGKNSLGNYHVFYIKKDEDNKNRAYHLYYNGDRSSFNTHISSLPMSVSDYSIYFNEKNNFLIAWFIGSKEDKARVISNSADYGPIINYRLTNIEPSFNSSIANTSTMLTWQIEGGTADSYDVIMGSSLYDLAPVSQNITDTSYPTAKLINGQTYYWQVVAKHNTERIYSDLWRFTVTAPLSDCVPPLTGDWTISNSCTLEEQVTAPANLIIQNGAVLTIEKNASINIDLSTHAIRVKKASGILVKKGGKII
jgi:hypothetical protein